MKSNENTFKKILFVIEIYKKEIFILIIFFSFLSNTIFLDYIKIFSPALAKLILYTSLSVLLIVFLNILLDVLYGVNSSQSHIKVIESFNLLDRIYEIIKDEDEITIEYVGISGITGWNSVIEKLLNKGDHRCLIHKKLDIKIALIEQSVLDKLEASQIRYSSVSNIIKDIERTRQRIEHSSSSSINIRLYRYDYMPNFLGFLINGNYLFSTMAYWDIEDGTKDSLVLRGGRRNHIEYSKNDNYGGGDKIKQFKGWLNYIKLKNNK